MRGPLDSYTRLLIFAVLFNGMLWSQFHQGEIGSFLIAIPYVLGFVIGWLISPWFRPKRDQWVKSSYNRFILRFLRGVTLGGLVAFLSVIIWKGINK